MKSNLSLFTLFIVSTFCDFFFSDTGNLQTLNMHRLQKMVRTLFWCFQPARSFRTRSALSELWEPFVFVHGKAKSAIEHSAEQANSSRTKPTEKGRVQGTLSLSVGP